MLYLIHDIYVNWVDGGSRKHEIPEYFEWKEGDSVELYDTIPLLVVRKEVFTILEDGYVDIPNHLLADVYREAARVNPATNRKNKVEYCFAITDRERVLVINTEGENKPNLKSRLLPKTELVITEIAEDQPIYEVDVKRDEAELKYDSALERNSLSVSPDAYVGLTRIEREMKQIVLDCLFHLSSSKNRAELVYWYIEMFPHMFGQTDGIDREIIINEMFFFLRLGWGKRHQEWGTNIIKVAPNDIYKDDWDKLVEESKKNVKVAN